MRSLRPLLALTALAALASCDTADPARGPTEIALLVVYTPGASTATGDIEAHVRRAVQETNQAYENSDVDARLALVHLAGVDYEITDLLLDLERLLLPDDGFLDEVHALRDQHEADVVALVSATPNATINAAVLAEASTAFTIVHWDGLGDPGYGLAHEIGHLQGARHAFEEDPLLEPFPYGHGFQNDAVRTIMANGPQALVPYFGGPDQVHDGIVLGDSTLRDVARVLRETAVYVSNFRGPRSPTDFEPPGTWPTLPDLDLD
jgi:hypothetical protein